MKKLLLAILLMVSFFTANSQVLRPSGLPTVNSTGRYEIGWLQGDSGFIWNNARDTFPAKYPTTIWHSNGNFYKTPGGIGSHWSIWIYNIPGSVTSVATTAPVLGGTITTTGTISLDTGRSNTQIPTGYDLNKVKDSVVQLIAGGGFGTVLSFSSTASSGIIDVVTNPSTTPTQVLSLGNITPSSVVSSGGITAIFFVGDGRSLGGVVKYTDTASMLSNLLRKTDTLTMLAPYLRKSDTANMLSGYARSGNLVTGVSSVTGTLNKVIASPTTGNVIVSLPSIISVDGITVTGNISTLSLSATGDVSSFNNNVARSLIVGSGSKRGLVTIKGNSSLSSDSIPAITIFDVGKNEQFTQYVGLGANKWTLGYQNTSTTGGYTQGLGLDTLNRFYIYDTLPRMNNGLDTVASQRYARSFTNSNNYWTRASAILSPFTAGDKIQTSGLIISTDGTFFSQLANGSIGAGVSGGNQTAMGSETISFGQNAGASQMNVRSRNLAAGSFNAYIQAKNYTFADSADVASISTGKLNISDTSSMLSGYARTGNLSNSFTGTALITTTVTNAPLSMTGAIKTTGTLSAGGLTSTSRIQAGTLSSSVLLKTLNAELDQDGTTQIRVDNQYNGVSAASSLALYGIDDFHYGAANYYNPVYTGQPGWNNKFTIFAGGLTRGMQFYNDGPQGTSNIIFSASSHTAPDLVITSYPYGNVLVGDSITHGGNKFQVYGNMYITGNIGSGIFTPTAQFHAYTAGGGTSTYVKIQNDGTTTNDDIAAISLQGGATNAFWLDGTNRADLGVSASNHFFYNNTTTKKVYITPWANLTADSLTGTTIIGTLSTATQQNVTSLGTQTALTVSSNAYIATSSGNLGVGAANTNISGFSKTITIQTAGSSALELVNTATPGNGSTAGAIRAFAGSTSNKAIGQISFDAQGVSQNTGSIRFTNWSSGTSGDVVVFGSTGVVTIVNLGTGAVQATAGTLSVVSDSLVKVDSGYFKGNALDAIMKLPKPHEWYFADSSISGMPKAAQKVKQFGFFANQVYRVLGERFAPSQPQSKQDSARGITKHGLATAAIDALLLQAFQEKAKQDELKLAAQQKQIDAQAVEIDKIKTILLKNKIQ